MARIEDLTWQVARETEEAAKDALGQMIAGMRSWELFGTMTYDPRRYPKEKTIVRGVWARDDGVPRVVSGDRAKSDFLGWVNDASGVLGRRIEFVTGMEFQKNGWPHFHALMDSGGIDQVDVIRIGQLWFARYGYNQLEIPRSVDKCAAYAAKYLVKDISLGDVIFSKRLTESVATLQRRLPAQAW